MIELTFHAKKFLLFSLLFPLPSSPLPSSFFLFLLFPLFLPRPRSSMLKRTVYSLLYLNYYCHAFNALSWRTGQLLSYKAHTSLFCAVDSDQEIELYNENGEEISNVQLDTLDINDIDKKLIAEADGVQNMADNVKKLIECNASILLPFGADVAFDAFSDLTRQP